MSSLKTPLQTLLGDLKDRLSLDLQDVTIYDHWIPSFGARIPCVSIIIVSSRQREVGIGQQAEAETKAVLNFFRIQLDVWARSPAKVLELADKVKLSLFKRRGEFGNYVKDIVKLDETGVTEEPLGSRRKAERLYRVRLEYETVYAISLLS